MKLVISIMLIFAVLVAPAFATDQVNISACSDVSGLLSDTNYDLVNDVDYSGCGGSLYFDGDGGYNQNNILNLHGFTLTAFLHQGGNDNYNLEVLNGTVIGRISMNPNGNNFGIWFHDLTINTTTSVSAFNFQYSGQGGGSDTFRLENIIVNLDNGAFINGLESSNVVIKNVRVNCIAGTCTDINSGSCHLYDTDVTFENVLFNGLTPLSTTDRICLGSQITLINTTMIEPPQNYGRGGDASNSRGGIRWINKQPLTISAKDQNNAPISAMATIRGTGGNQPFINKNDDAVETSGIDNGNSVVWLTKNITYLSFDTTDANTQIDTNTATYNVTVKSRGQSQSKFITFNSPASADFIFDFSEPKIDWIKSFIDWIFGKPANAQAQENFTLPEQDGGTVDNRTSTEITTNNITGFTIIFVSVGMILFIVKAVF